MKLQFVIKESGLYYTTQPVVQLIYDLKVKSIKKISTNQLKPAFSRQLFRHHQLFFFYYFYIIQPATLKINFLVVFSRITQTSTHTHTHIHLLLVFRAVCNAACELATKKMKKRTRTTTKKSNEACRMWQFFHHPLIYGRCWGLLLGGE